MSSTTANPASESRPRPPSHYAERAKADDETWIEDAIEDVLGLTVTEAQRKICRSVASNQKTLVVTANGLGKSYILAAIVNVWLYALYPATVLTTSGTEKKMKRTFCKPVDNLHSSARITLPGTYKHRPERIEFADDPEHWFEATSPQDAGELEGVHSRYHLSIIEEADKKDVDADTLDAMDSLVTDQRDRMIAIANPPEDDANLVADLMDKRTWETVRFSSFDSHNVQVELGNVDGEMIDGLATLWKIKEDWREFNDEPWPGVEQAKTWSDPDSDEFREELDKRWFRRRAGRIPPAGAATWRPYHLSVAKRVFDSEPAPKGGRPIGSGLDVARSGDSTVLITAYPDRLVVRDTWEGTDYPQQEADIMAILDEDPYHPLAVDAAGEGSGLADYLADRWPDTHRFRADGVPPMSDSDRTTDTDYGATNYRSQRSEALAALGDWLEDASTGAVTDNDLRTELLAGARTITFSERFLASRGENGETVVEANSKDVVKEQLGHSPDYLDASMLAVWAAKCAPQPIDASNAVVF